ncbi:hypothetical protein QTP70_000090 [Hemibagrus guttatus]|uniref:Reverse transcriptase domain-containing protein n=1 Tax=Hemibagrus guttatus TaxID=175788 RepID=A0AAE0V862_9TELE|nr:hypothetical protein QTP70_000090 [Hemibagrus guttatus]
MFLLDSQDIVVLLAPSSQDLQNALGRFAAECEAAEMRISTSKSEAMVLDRKKVACTLQVGGEFLPQVEEFKYLGVLFTSEGRMDREIDRRIGAAAVVMRSMYRSVVVKNVIAFQVSSRSGMPRKPPQGAVQEASQLAPLDVEEQRLYSELLPGDRAPYPIFKGATRHPMEETHFGRLYPGSCPFGHDPKLMTIGESRNVD